MVDTLWYNDETRTVSGFTIPEDNIFCENGFFKEPGIIENIAQTAALRAGYMASQMANKGEEVKPPVGYIGAVKKLTIVKLPKAGSEVMTEVVIEHVIFDVTLIRGIVTQNSDTIAECEMKIFLKKD